MWRRPLPIIPNGVPTEVFIPPDKDAESGRGASFRLLFVGNWRDSRKGLPVLLEAFQMIRAQGVDATLDVIGEGKPSEAQRGFPGVTFLGVVGSEAALADHYRRCDLFVAPATGQESFGIVLIEAMACGRPIVCSDIRGYRDVVDPEGAELVPAGDSVALSRVIVELANAPARRATMGARNRLRAEAFDWGRIALEVRNVYAESILRRSKTSAG